MSEIWNATYAGAPPPWDIGRPQPAVVRLADSGAFRSPVLDAGCGTGENALELARRGNSVWGVDAAARAIESARSKADARGLVASFLVGDALDLKSVGETFASVLDCGLFHTFSDELRRRYVGSLADVVVPGGVLFLLCFSEHEPWGGGPRRVTQDEIRTSFADGWLVRSIEAERFATRIHDEGAYAWLAGVERLQVTSP